MQLDQNTYVSSYIGGKITHFVWVMLHEEVPLTLHVENALMENDLNLLRY